MLPSQVGGGNRSGQVAAGWSMAKFVVDYSIEGEGGPEAPDGRLYSSAFERNHAPIIAALSHLLADRVGALLEIGCGTGQHALKIAEAFPGLTVRPSDPNPRHVASARAWRLRSGRESGQDLGLDLGLASTSGNLGQAEILDVMDRAWEPGGAPIAFASLAGILAINVLHIAPWGVTIAILVGAGRYLREDGVLLIYGPFSKDGQHTAPSNAAFDADLRAADSEWGVRDLAEIEAAAHIFGLEIAEVVPMPANNFLLCIKRA